MPFQNIILVACMFRCVCTTSSYTYTHERAHTRRFYARRLKYTIRTLDAWYFELHERSIAIWTSPNTLKSRRTSTTPSYHMCTYTIRDMCALGSWEKNATHHFVMSLEYSVSCGQAV